MEIGILKVGLEGKWVNSSWRRWGGGHACSGYADFTNRSGNKLVNINGSLGDKHNLIIDIQQFKHWTVSTPIKWFYILNYSAQAPPPASMVQPVSNHYCCLINRSPCRTQK